MNKTFSWENFPKAFLVAVLQRKDVPEGIRITDDSLSMLRLSARMDRFCKNPDIAFVKTFRREIEKYIFDNERYLTIICSKLKFENYAGIKVDSIDKMHNSIAALDMNRTIASLYSNILQNIGLSIEADELNNFYLNKKKLDLSAIIPSDISLEYYQKEAVSYLREFYNNKKAGLLVMPTGSGKTRTAVYFLLRYVISQGYQVIWLAHRSLLLEQTANTFYRNASLLKLAEPERKKLTLLCISSEHCSIHQADKKDDIIIGGVQSLSGRTDTFSFFLRKKVMIVVDEAHHTVAKSYRNVIEKILSISPNAKLLGLTATPFRASAKETPQLLSIYKNNYIYQISMGTLIADDFLSKPTFETIKTGCNIETHIDLNEEAYIRKWGELSPELINFVAGIAERNELIVETYLKKRKEYGKTLIFAMNAVQCMSLCDMLVKKGGRCDYVYSGEPNNTEKIYRFKNGDLDVLININILSEGSDIPDIETVFLTRPTQSDVMLSQMMGRGMRGKAFNGTDTVTFVDFYDQWDRFQQWLNPKYIFEAALPFEENLYHSSKTIKKPWDMFRDIFKSITLTYNGELSEVFVSFPVGWYDARDTKIIVFENQVDGYEKLMNDFKGDFECFPTAKSIIHKYFRSFCLPPSENDIQYVLREMKRSCEPLKLHLFEDYSKINAITVAKSLLNNNMPAIQIENSIDSIYDNNKIEIDALYETKERFRSKVYDALISIDNVPIIGSVVKELPDELLPYNTEPQYNDNDLIKMRDEVIKEMFNKKHDPALSLKHIEIPDILWTDKAYCKYFGAYDPRHNLILVNRILNSSSVKRECIKFIIYHELLHTLIDKHNKEFRRLERLYPDTSEHNHFLDYTFGEFDFFNEYRM